MIEQLGLIDQSTGQLLTMAVPRRRRALGETDAKPSKVLDRIAVPAGAALVVTLHCSEFTCRCPVTNQPDWAHIDVTYEPDQWLVESKSMKLYLETFRETGIFHEHLVQRILEDFVEQIEPVTCEVTANFNTRGGIAISVTAQHYEYPQNGDGR